MVSKGKSFHSSDVSGSGVANVANIDSAQLFEYSFIDDGFKVAVKNSPLRLQEQVRFHLIQSYHV